MKICCRCKQSKPKIAFYKDKHQIDGLTRACKSCDSKRTKKYYTKTKKRYIKRAATRYEENKRWYSEYKQTLECIECGEDRPQCLTFHHKDPKQKEFVISNWYAKFGKERVLKEIDKCDVLCFNCHANLHHLERIKAS